MSEHLNLPELEKLLFPDGSAPDDADGLTMCGIILDVLVARYGHDHVVGLLAELAELEHSCGQYDDDYD
jgi:hypothetical protein